MPLLPLRSGRMASSSQELPPVPARTKRNSHGGSPGTGDKGETEVELLRSYVVQLRQHIESFRTNFQAKLDDISQDCSSKVSTETLKSQLDTESGILIARITQVETRVARLEQTQAERLEYDTETTVVAQGLHWGNGDNILAEAKKMVNQVLGLDVDVVRAKQLPSRNGRPGLVKVQLNSLQEKIQLLRAKHDLKQKEGYRNVFIRSSKTHMERLLELNIKTMLEEIPSCRNKFRLTASGRLVRKDDQADGIQNRYIRDNDRNQGSAADRNQGQMGRPRTQ